MSIRLGIFVSVLILFAVLEAVFPKRSRVQSRRTRWTANIGLSAINTVLLRLSGPVTAIAAASFAEANGFGILNQFDLPNPAALLITIILLDLAIYGQHVATHYVPFLWRLHAVHHTDRDLDASSGLRFHPGEAMLSMFYKALIVLAIGPAAWMVVAYEVTLNAASIFTHANLRLPVWLDRALRWIIVTPDMHRVHHSVIVRETNSNFGNFLSVWDRVFGTYIPQPEQGHDAMTIGLNAWQDERPGKIGFALTLPTYKEVSPETKPPSA